MDIRVGYRIEITTTQPVSCMTLLDPHPSRTCQCVSTRMDLATGAGGSSSLSAAPFFANDIIVRDAGTPDQWDMEAPEILPDDLPSEVIEYGLSSRYCEVDELSAIA